MKRFVLLCLITMFAFSGCAWFQTEEEKTSQELINEGMDQYNDEHYKDAIASFEKLKDWYPFSQYAILAELKLGDAYYHLEEYEDAIAAYEDFESLHPRNEAIPYVIYQIGLCYYDRIDTIDRDQSTAHKALETFERLRKQFPKDPYSIKAEQNIKKCQKSLAEHDLYVGLFYYKSRHYKAALQRFIKVLTNYPDVGVHQRRFNILSSVRRRSKKQW